MRWYKQNSDLYDRLWAKDPKMVTVYVYLHIAAYVHDSMLYGMIIRRGSCLIKYDEMAKRVGLTVKELRLRLERLSSCGEILIKRTNRGVVVTVCDYDSSYEEEDLFSENGATKGQPKGNPRAIQGQSKGNHINIDSIDSIEYKNLRSNNIPSKKERESDKALVYEIKALYNKTFEGKLPEWKRLSEKMVIMVDACVTTYGRQSVDMVFDQVLNEPFSLGQNKTGFLADAFFIFTLDQYEKYLGRYKLRKSKKQPSQPTKEQSVFDKEKEPTREEQRRMLLIQWVEAPPSARRDSLLKQCYESGELQSLGIEWKPNTI